MSTVKMGKGIRYKKGLRYYAGVAWMKAFGWEFSMEEFPERKKMVLAAVPHTSNWDLPFMLACSYISGLKISWLGKHTIFKGPGKWFFGWLGGVPVDRRAPRGLVAQVVEEFERREELALAIPPEGTRGYTEGWKTGFYYIALGAKVPIVLTYLDFGKKRAGFGPVIMPTGDIEADFERFHAFYKDVQAKFPQHQSPVKPREKKAQASDAREASVPPSQAAPHSGIEA